MPFGSPCATFVVYMLSDSYALGQFVRRCVFDWGSEKEWFVQSERDVDLLVWHNNLLVWSNSWLFRFRRLICVELAQ